MYTIPHVSRSGRLVAASLLAAAVTGAAARAQTVAWAWVNPVGAGATFTPSPSYQYTPTGETIVVERDPAQQNRFFVEIPGVLPSTGVVHASPYGGNHVAVVNSWVTNGDNVRATIELFTPTGAPANDARFTVHFRREGNATQRDAYLYAEQATAASYTPTTNYSWNGNRPDPTITRTGPGAYQVTLPGLASSSSESGHVQVTPHNSGFARAKVASWSHGANDVVVHVRTFDVAGAPADSRFVLSYNEKAAPIAAADGSGAHVWANNAVAASYTPSAAYTDSNGRLGPANGERITRLATGSYRVELPNLAPSQSSIAMVTAYGSSADHASVSSWSGNGNGGTVVNVATWNAAGSPTDAQFDLLYLTNRPAEVQDVAWAWVYPGGAGATFTPSTTYQRTPSGALITVDRDPVLQNRFVVRFPGLAPSTGVVHACAQGGNHTVVVNNWLPDGDDVLATVTLYNAVGGPANDAAFSIHYRRGGPNTAREAYLWADQASAPSYTPSAAYSWNGKRPDPTITRTGTGIYQVTLPELSASGSPELGHVQVTAYGSTFLRAKVSAWSHGATDVVATVRCFDAAGAPTDGRFVLSYNETAAPMAPDLGSGAHVWADQPTVASYTPNANYTDSNGTFGPANAETITRLSTGFYRVSLPNLTPVNDTIALVTAHGSSAHYASVASWGTDGSGGAAVNVATYDASGVPADSRFTLLFLTNRSSVTDPGARNRAFGTGCGDVALTATPDPVSTAANGTNVTYWVHGAPEFAGVGSPSLGLVILTLDGNLGGIPLAGLGAPGCFAHVNSLDATLLFTGNAGLTATVSFNLPAGVPGGTLLFAQAAALTTTNAFGIVTSNGVESRIDDF